MHIAGCTIFGAARAELHQQCSNRHTVCEEALHRSILVFYIACQLIIQFCLLHFQFSHCAPSYTLLCVAIVCSFAFSFPFSHFVRCVRIVFFSIREGKIPPIQINRCAYVNLSNLALHGEHTVKYNVLRQKCCCCRRVRISFSDVLLYCRCSPSLFLLLFRIIRFYLLCPGRSHFARHIAYHLHAFCIFISTLRLILYYYSLDFVCEF